MTSGGHAAHAATLRDYLHVVRRRKWIILQAVVLVPLAALLFSLNQEKLYQAQAQVLLSSQNLAAQLTGTQVTGVSLQPDRIAQTQATSRGCPSWRSASSVASGARASRRRRSCSPRA